MEWKKGTPPKDRKILAMLENYPGPALALWSEKKQKFGYADIQTSMLIGKWDTLQVSYAQEEEILMWQEAESPEEAILGSINPFG